MSDAETAETVADLDDDRTVYVRSRWRGGEQTRVHLDEDCTRLRPAVDYSDKAAGEQFDDTKVCRECRDDYQHYEGGGDGPWTDLMDADPDDLATDGGRNQ